MSLTANLSAYAEPDGDDRIQYKDRSTVAGSGIFLDDINITGSPTDDAESDPGVDVQS